jgi:phenylalanyl-tRNA synthetase beta chain
VARFYGYDKIPSLVTPVDAFEPEKDTARDCVGRLRETLLRRGLDEVLNWSFADPDKEKLVGNSCDPVAIRNPISNRASVLRTNLFMGLLEKSARNRNRGLDGVHIFEIGNVYFRKEDACRERLALGILSSGLLPGAGWQEKPRPGDFFFLKGTIEAAMARLRYDPVAFKAVKQPAFEEGWSLALLHKSQPVGRLGVLNSGLLAAYGLEGPVFAAEIDLEGLFEKQPRPFHIVPVPRFPGVNRDLSFLADRGVAFQEIRKILDKPPLANLESYELVDRFSGPSIPADKVSLSIRFRFRNTGRTLLAEEVDKVEQDIIDRLKSTFHIQMREGSIDNRT